MQSLTLLLKSIIVNGHIPADKALKLADHFDQEREETKILLRALKSEVGMYRGEQIEIQLAKMDGTNFNSSAYNYERLPNGQ